MYLPFPMSSLILLIAYKIVLVNCLPKLGHDLVDPLLLESNNDIEKHEANIKFDDNSDDDFLENTPSIEVTSESIIDFNQTRIEIEHFNSADYKSSTQINRKEQEENVTETNIPVYRATNKNNQKNKTEEQNGMLRSSVKVSGYDYDDMMCKTVNDRILCGYNKNHGVIPKDDEITYPASIPEGCKLRNNVIECGHPRIHSLRESNDTSDTFNKTQVFVKTSTESISRVTEDIQTPVSNTTQQSPIPAEEIKTQESTTEHNLTIAQNVETTESTTQQSPATAHDMETTESTTEQTSTTCSTCSNKESLRDTSNSESFGTKTTRKAVTRCFEIHDRIVCVPFTSKPLSVVTDTATEPITTDYNTTPNNATTGQ